ncbi:MAG: glutamine--fructose-6-phosphate transaminase (isomerizing) [Candidatus Caenarcaniphilales bacterium]|nr:glutamine--fructose-6-phosphate transaminase (isomerizing) [Candidatus Caenarcaniphilales bacterium]
MCGIVSYVGSEPKAARLLLQGLKSLEYRGYDSSGIALLNDSVKVYKNKGKILDLEKNIYSLSEQEQSEVEQSICGIGHTRWATHGEPNDVNAHPHLDSDASLAIVHNGIIRNYQSLRSELETKGFVFKSDTDTEVIANMFSSIRKELLSINAYEDFKALRELSSRLEGSYALAIIINDSNLNDVTKPVKRILLAKNESPLVIGIGDQENFAASDSDTVLQFTDKIVRLADKELAVISKNTIEIQDFDGNEIKPIIEVLKQNDSIMDKKGYKHFLLKEIYEQPTVLSKMLSLIEDQSFTNFKLMDFQIDFTNIEKVYCIACGSAYHSAQVLKSILGTWAAIPVEVIIASEFNYQVNFLSEKDLVVGISQSGETADTILALQRAKKTGANLLAITNRPASAINNLCGVNTYITPADIEISVASTKAYTSQILAHYLLALQIAVARKALAEEFFNEILHNLKMLPVLIEQTLHRANAYKEQSLNYANYKDFIFLSRGINHVTAMEGALKLKELSYAHATAYPSGELKHGPIAILDENVPVISISIPSKYEDEQVTAEKVIHNALEAKTRKAPSILLTTDSNQDHVSEFDLVVRIPDIDQVFSPILATIPLQFWAYYIAEDLGKDVDQPRNLAKSVTVE